jgi:hypothetical protein
MNKILELLKGFDQLASDINEMELQVRTGDEPYREATPQDKLDYIRQEWFNLAYELNELGFDVTE